MQLTSMEKCYVAQKALCVDANGRVLLLRLVENGRWDAPGGRLEEGEEPIRALAREVREETGMTFQLAEARPFFVDRWETGGSDPQPIIGVYYRISVDQPVVELSFEHNAYQWVDLRTEADLSPFGLVGRALEAYREHYKIHPFLRRTVRQGYGLVQLYTGDGKGKTTAALGEAFRAVGAGKRVGIVFFDKGGEHYSERRLLDQLSPEAVTYVATGRDRINAETGAFDLTVTQEDGREAQRGLEVARTMCTDASFDVVVLDEINTAAALGMLREEDVLHLIRSKNDRIELILTGRRAPSSFVETADLVTDVGMRRHYFYDGVLAREGLDY